MTTARDEERPKPLIFFSHSAESEADFATLSSIKATLVDAGFDVFVASEDIRKGEEWRPEIQRKLMRCHGCLVLLSRPALKAPWVFLEVGVVMARRADSQGAMPVQALLMEDVRAGEVMESKLRHTGLPSLQYDFLSADCELPGPVLTQLRALHEEYGYHPYAALEGRFADGLSLLTDGSLRVAAKALPVDVAPHAERHLPRQIARALITAEHNRMRAFLEQVGAQLGQKFRKDAIDVSTAWTSIPEEAAAQVLAVSGSASRCSAALPVEKIRTAKLYVRRACLTPRVWCTYDIAPMEPEDWGTRLRREVRRTLSEEHFRVDDGELSDDELREALAERGGDSPIVFLLRGVVDRDLVGQLTSDWPGVLFLHVDTNVMGADGEPLYELLAPPPTLPEGRLLLRLGDLNSTYL
ncbi:toll/interleukin-1 receptor domain-containing protein [Streptomyces sp. S.PNR 29]|uniref:toll/interleukin-1 receptor domain-containing protein n=1 Tax=Streptomyces sp. S.PNR 29 TaxID=2973805 RepID=UPI0025AED496|nr:toll/interleukin-1 receptor domain-containing protein [Streptomyces sp. S.PNR 29]MDN0196557.1 toll/interleukin-1 receptor domain-containing protein [Streptomyces sp. S.PNR 29]